MRESQRRFVVVLLALVVLVMAGGAIFRSHHNSAAVAVLDASRMPAPQLRDAGETPAPQVQSDPFTQFDRWTNDYCNSAEKRDAASVARGIDLARARRTALRELICTNPDSALKRAISADVRASLPAAVAELLEREANGDGRLDIWCASPAEDRHEPFVRTHRRVELNGARYEAFVHGRGRDLQTGPLAVRGISVDNALALSESSSSLKAAVRAASGLTTTPNTLLYIIAKFSDEAAYPIDVPTATGYMNDTDQFFRANSYGKTSITTTFVQVTMPQTVAYYMNLDPLGQVIPFEQILSDGISAAISQASKSASSFDLYIVATSYLTGQNFGYGGIAHLGNPPGLFAGLHLNGNFKLTTAGHELGHNYGLNHSNYWLSDSISPIGRDSVPGVAGDGVNDEWTEYGHIFAMMGGPQQYTRTPQAHFVARDKVYLGWIGNNEMAAVTSSAKVRVYRHDDMNATGTPRTVKIDRPTTDYTGNGRKYWLSYRMAFNGDNNLESFKNGLEIDWCKDTYTYDGCVLLDMTPQSHDGPYDNRIAGFYQDSDDKIDAALGIGLTYADTAAGIFITPLAKGGGAPNEYIEAQINIGSFAGNHAPMISAINVNTAVTPNQLSATASDADGDTLAYSWDFGDSTFSNVNSAIQNKLWAAAGNYTVKCTVSDMKGGTATLSKVVNIAAVADVKADLVVESISILGIPPKAGGTGTFGVTIRNQGNADVTAPFGVGFFTDKGSAPTSASTPDVSVTVPPLIAAGNAATVSVTISNVTFGNHTSFAFADAAGAIAELSTANNSGPAGGFAWFADLPLIITSGPTATPTAAVIGSTISFSVTAQKATTYTWDFGDGSSAVSGASTTASHAYAASGIYTVSLTASNSDGEMVTQTVKVYIFYDSDKDNIPDLDPSGNNADFPDIYLAATNQTAVPLNVKKLAIALNFAKLGQDTLALSGTVAVPAGFAANQKKVVALIGGFVTSGTMDSKGSALVTLGKFSVAANPKGSSAARFGLSIGKAALANFFAAQGLTNKTVTNEMHTIRTTVLFNGVLYDVLKSQLYTAKFGKSGKTK